MKKINRFGQQEIVGFVLIVVLVVIGLMVFLIISLRDTPENDGSLEVGNMLDALMKHTTECAVVYEPDYDDFEALFKSCHQKDSCSNLDKSACDYLNESLRDVVGAMVASEGGNINFYQLDFLVKDTASRHENLQAGDVGEEGLLRISEVGHPTGVPLVDGLPGSTSDRVNCTGGVNAAQINIVSDSDSLVIRLKVCGL